MESVWCQCLSQLEGDISEQDLNTWVRPLQAELDGRSMRLFAPNRFVKDWIDNKLLLQITSVVHAISSEIDDVIVNVGCKKPIFKAVDSTKNQVIAKSNNSYSVQEGLSSVKCASFVNTANLNAHFTFQNYVNGDSNQMGYVAALAAANKPDRSNFPLFLYGGVGLGKTHLMHAAGNLILANNHKAKIIVTSADRFFNEMVRSVKTNTLAEFKYEYSSADALLIDDVQFFANKGKTQDVFYHVFNTLIERNCPVILTCDKLPKEVKDITDSLVSRFSSGLVVKINPPGIETRSKILISKAENSCVSFPDDVAYLIAKKIRSNVRELEGALNRLVAYSSFTGKAITLDLAQEALKDLLAVEDRQVSIESIQKAIVEYFKLKESDLKSNSRKKSVVRPRQIAMMLAKKLTNNSLNEIGESFGGRDHTTVLYACKQVEKHRQSDSKFDDDYNKLTEIISG